MSNLFNDLVLKGVYSDFKITINCNVYTLHKSILKKYDFFMALMRQKNIDPVVIRDNDSKIIDHNTILACLQYLYLGQIEMKLDLGGQMIYDVHKVLDYMCIPKEYLAYLWKKATGNIKISFFQHIDFYESVYKVVGESMINTLLGKLKMAGDDTDQKKYDILRKSIFGESRKLMYAFLESADEIDDDE